MPRKRRSLIRPDAVRDAKLIVVATEDTKASGRYVETLVSPKYYQSTRVQGKVLTRGDTASSPERVLAQLDEWRKEYELAEDDELWLVIDVDRWGDAKLSQIAQACEQKLIRLAVSNPAIELWFLLHLTGLEQYDAERLGRLQANKKVNANRSELEQAIIEIVGSFNKSNLDVDRYIPHIELAISRAARLDVQPEDRWPQQLGTRVYLLVRSMIASSAYRNKYGNNP